MQETSKSRARREAEGFDRYLRGKVLDIGCGDDKITPDATGWDVDDGDAQKLESVPNSFYDTVYSSHCLEHMRDPLEALLNWWRVLKPGGYLIVAVPDEDLYEQGVWPSFFNGDHKFTYTASKSESWSMVSKNVVDLLRLLPSHKLISLRTIDTGYDYDIGDLCDQTEMGAEAHVEFIVQKVAVVGHQRSELMRLFNCLAPNCGRAEYRMEGMTAEGAIRCVCMGCGTAAEMTLKHGDAK